MNARLELDVRAGSLGLPARFFHLFRAPERRGLFRAARDSSLHV